MLLRCWLRRSGCVSQDAYILHCCCCCCSFFVVVDDDNDNDNYIDNDNDIHSEPSIKSDRGQHSQYLTYNVSLYILHFTCSNTKVLLQWRRNECEDSACLPRSEHQLQPVSKVVAKWRACLPCQGNCEFCFQNSSPIFRCACVRAWTSVTSLHISII